MSTRSHIIVEVPTDCSTDYVYHHSDGYLDGVGAELKKFIKNEYNPVTFTGEEFCTQLEDWDDSYEYENSGPHGDEEYLYTIIIDKEDSVINISAEAVSYYKNDFDGWEEHWEPCKNFSETLPIDLSSITKTSAIKVIDLADNTTISSTYDTKIGELKKLVTDKYESGYLKSKFG